MSRLVSSLVPLDLVPSFPRSFPPDVASDFLTQLPIPNHVLDRSEHGFITGSGRLLIATGTPPCVVFADYLNDNPVSFPSPVFGPASRSSDDDDGGFPSLRPLLSSLLTASSPDDLPSLPSPNLGAPDSSPLSVLRSPLASNDVSDFASSSLDPARFDDYHHGVDSRELEELWKIFLEVRMKFIVRCKYRVCALRSGVLNELWQNNLTVRGVLLRRMQCPGCSER